MRCPIPAETPGWRRAFDAALEYSAERRVKVHVECDEIVLETLGDPHEQVIRDWHFTTYEAMELL